MTKEMKQMMKQIAKMDKKIEYMQKEMYEIRKGNTLGEY